MKTKIEDSLKSLKEMVDSIEVRETDEGIPYISFNEEDTIDIDLYTKNLKTLGACLETLFFTIKEKEIQDKLVSKDGITINKSENEEYNKSSIALDIVSMPLIVPVVRMMTMEGLSDMALGINSLFGGDTETFINLSVRHEDKDLSEEEKKEVDTQIH